MSVLFLVFYNLGILLKTFYSFVVPRKIQYLEWRKEQLHTAQSAWDHHSRQLVNGTLGWFQEKRCTCVRVCVRAPD